MEPRKKRPYKNQREKRFKSFLVDRDWHQVIDYINRVDVPYASIEQAFIGCFHDDQTHQLTADGTFWTNEPDLEPSQIRLHRREYARYSCAIGFVIHRFIEEDRAIELGFPAPLIGIRDMSFDEAYQWIQDNHDL